MRVGVVDCGIQGVIWTLSRVHVICKSGVYMCVHVCVHVCVCMCVCRCVHVCVQHVCVHVCVHVCHMIVSSTRTVLMEDLQCDICLICQRFDESVMCTGCPQMNKTSFNGYNSTLIS